MFFKNNTQQQVNVPTKELAEIRHEYELRIKELEADHKLALKEKEFELRHFKDDEIVSLKDQVSKKDQTIAVLQKENQMLEKITNLNADIIDIKGLVANLIEKLPTINLQNLTLNGSSKE